MKKFLMEYWFQIMVIVLLLMCYVRLGKVSENTLYTADIVDSSAFDTGYTLGEISRTLDDIELNTKNTWYSVQSSY